MRYKIIPIILSLLMLSSCRSFLFYQRNKFTVYKQFDGNSRGLRLDGVYMSSKQTPISDSVVVWPDLTILYNDGTVYQSSNVHANAGLSLDSLLSAFPRSKRRSPLHWGGFTIEKDSTFILQTWGIMSGAYFNLFEQKGRVLTDTSFILYTYSFPEKEAYKYGGITYYFQPLTRKPDSTNWMMKDGGFNRKAARRSRKK